MYPPMAQHPDTYCLHRLEVHFVDMQHARLMSKPRR